MTNEQEFRQRREEEYRDELRQGGLTEDEIEEAVRDSRAGHPSLTVGERNPGLAGRRQ